MPDVNELREVLEKLLAAVGEPWDIDQDCRFCAGHYDWHEDSCPWHVARSTLDSFTESKP